MISRVEFEAKMAVLQIGLQQPLDDMARTVYWRQLGEIMAGPEFMAIADSFLQGGPYGPAWQWGRFPTVADFTARMKNSTRKQPEQAAQRLLGCVKATKQPAAAWMRAEAQEKADLWERAAGAPAGVVKPLQVLFQAVCDGIGWQAWDEALEAAEAEARPHLVPKFRMVKNGLAMELEEYTETTQQLEHFTQAASWLEFEKRALLALPKAWHAAAWGEFLKAEAARQRSGHAELVQQQLLQYLGATPVFELPLLA